MKKKAKQLTIDQVKYLNSKNSLGRVQLKKKKTVDKVSLKNRSFNGEPANEIQAL